MNDETKILLVMGGFAIMLCGWAYYHCLMRQREKYDNLKKAFLEDKRKTDFFDQSIEKLKRKPQVRKPAVKKAAVKKPVAKKVVAKKTTTKGIK